MSARSILVATCAAAAFAAAVWLVLGHARASDGEVTLTFERYSDFDPYVSNVAFLRLTNASSKSYLLTMTGNTNTLVLDTSFGRSRMSWMVNCEFSDETATGRTNWAQLPSPFIGGNSCATLAPHSGIVVRVPVPLQGQRRRVAVLYQPAMSGWRQSKFWTTPAGLATVRILVRILPRPALSKLMTPKSVLLRAWCDRELTNHWDGVGKGAR